MQRSQTQCVPGECLVCSNDSDTSLQVSSGCSCDAIRQDMFVLFIEYQCWGCSLKLFSSISALLSSVWALACCAPTSLLTPRQVSSVTSLAVRQTASAMPAWLPTFSSHQKRLFFFFFNSHFQLSNDSDTAARVKWSSSLSDFYGKRPWVASLKSQSLLGKAVGWIQFFNLTDRTDAPTVLYICWLRVCASAVDEMIPTNYLCSAVLGRGGWVAKNSCT